LSQTTDLRNKLRNKLRGKSVHGNVLPKNVRFSEIYITQEITLHILLSGRAVDA